MRESQLVVTAPSARVERAPTAQSSRPLRRSCLAFGCHDDDSVEEGGPANPGLAITGAYLSRVIIAIWARFLADALKV